jgi:biotin transport system substrate-specific component
MPVFSISANASRTSPLTSEPARRIVRGLAATLVVAVAAHVALPLPFTPVPFTLQPLAVLVVGLLLGPWDGALAMLAYLIEGASGLPVFSPAPMALGGVAQLIGPTGGYLMAYPAVALVAGFLAPRLTRVTGAFTGAVLGCTVATMILFLSGASWLAHIAHLSSAAVWTAAVAPFLAGEAVKILVAAGVYRALQPHQSR